MVGKQSYPLGVWFILMAWILSSCASRFGGGLRRGQVGPATHHRRIGSTEKRSSLTRIHHLVGVTPIQHTQFVLGCSGYGSAWSTHGNNLGLSPAPADRGHLVLRSVGQRKLHMGLSEGHGLGKRGGSACVGLDILDVSGLLFGYVSWF